MNAAKSVYDEPSGKAKRTILVVEDVVLVRLVVAEQLRQAGFDVIEARTADEAIRLLGAPLPIDLVFSDIHLPGSSLDGFGLARWITDKRPETKVLLTSGQVPSPGPNGEDLLVKPYKYPELIHRLHELLSLPPDGT
ncbi:MAG: response regulator [Reyranella sp.]|uniref:response regulator n=1 Tax=Reyranella sp. TaxID=1929291 RepID=UPI00272FEFA0|nr:response regulator [Reyranella sp.]MDP1961038.1 response regulator [Reyranella sp.]MDP2372151.1 response regulator [Reyranella sp.]